MKKKSKRTLTPKLRFPEFRKEPGWKEVPLEQIAERVTTKNLDASIARVLTNSAEHGILDQRDYFDKDIANAGNIDGYYIVDLGDYVYNPRISTLAPVGPISRNNIGKGVMSPLYTVFRFAEENTDFYQHYFKTASWHFYLRRVSSMGARHDRMSITTGDFMAMPVPTPLAKEQQKIAECLSSLDGLIAAEGRKLEALKAHKKGLMQQLFPREGETQPRLRFPEFRDKGEWVVAKLGQLGKLISGLTYSPEDVRDKGFLVLRSSNIQDGKIALDDCVYVTPTIKGANLAKPNDILICVRNGSKPLIGKNAMIPEGIPKCTHGAFMTVLRAHAASFVFQLLQTSDFQRQVAADLGATINSINSSNLLRYRFFVPTEPLEQKRIADCLTALDTQIAAQATKVVALRTHKPGLMQQLFPAPEEQ